MDPVTSWSREHLMAQRILVAAHFTAQVRPISSLPNILRQAHISGRSALADRLPTQVMLLLWTPAATYLLPARSLDPLILEVARCRVIPRTSLLPNTRAAL